MKLQQLRYIWEVAHHDLNVSATAQSLYTSQPGISKQVRLLEDELGVEIFARSGKHLTQITPAGEKILQVAGEVLQQVESIRRLAQEYKEPDRGTLNIAVTHTQARYILPKIIRQYSREFPNVTLRLQQATPDRVVELLADGMVDLAISSNGLEHNRDLVSLPCYRWGQSILVPENHSLSQERNLTLEALAEYPLVTCAAGFSGQSMLDKAFMAKGLIPNLACTATDTDVIKTYVRAGMGVGIVASMAYEPENDKDLVAIDVRNLFEPCLVKIGLSKGAYLRKFTYHFIAMIAPHLTQEVVDQAVLLHTRDEREKLFRSIRLPEY